MDNAELFLWIPLWHDFVGIVAISSTHNNLLSFFSLARSFSSSSFVVVVFICAFNTIHSLHLLKLVFFENATYGKWVFQILLIVGCDIDRKLSSWRASLISFNKELLVYVDGTILKEQTLHLLQLVMFGSVKNMNYSLQFCAIFLWMPQYVHVLCICWC